MTAAFTIQPGLPPGSEDAAADLYWDAFGEKLGLIMGPRRRAIKFIRKVIDPSHGISAVDPDGDLLGVVGYKTNKGALVGGSFQDMREVYGMFGALWRAALVSLLERDTENDRFLMDGLFVAPQARGKGVGTALLEAIAAEGKSRGYPALRLDVIDTNWRAQALYERFGFRPVKTMWMGPLRLIFKFRSSTTMVLDL